MSTSVPATAPARKAAFPGYHMTLVPEPVAGIDPTPTAPVYQPGDIDPEVASAIDDAWQDVKKPGVVTFVIDSNPNYTNYCDADCLFCAFYRKPGHAEQYWHSVDEIVEMVGRAVEVPRILPMYPQGPPPPRQSLRSPHPADRLQCGVLP